MARTKAEIVHLIRTVLDEHNHFYDQLRPELKPGS
jgi:hypothetical protein